MAHDPLSKVWQQFPQLRDAVWLSLIAASYMVLIGIVSQVSPEAGLLRQIDQVIAWSKEAVPFYPTATALDAPTAGAAARYFHFGFGVFIYLVLALSVLRIFSYTKAFAQYDGVSVEMRNWLYRLPASVVVAAVLFLFMVLLGDYLILTADAADLVRRRRPSNLFLRSLYGSGEVRSVVAWSLFTWLNAFSILWAVSVVAYGAGLRPSARPNRAG